MKKLLTLSACLLMVVAVFAQQPKMVFVEEGTQASCGPCGAQNPAFDALLEANSDKVISLKYQSSWPGFDQMNLDNPADAQARLTYYGINGVPTATLNGSIYPNDCGYWEGAPICLEQSEIDEAYLDIADFDINLTTAIVNGQLEITGSVVANAAVSGNLKLRLAVAEEQIDYADVPGGTNGETEYFHVMKKLLPSASGITLEGTWAMGDTYTIDETFNLGSITVYNYSAIEVIAWIQDDNSKDVLQAAKSTDIPATTDYANNPTAIEVSGLPNTICAGTNTLSPVFKLQNNGNDVLETATILYSVNGGDEQSVEWEGNLPTLGSEDVQLNAISFNAPDGAPSILNVMVTSPNGVDDEDSSDNGIEQVLELSPESTNNITVHILTDAYGDEIYWEVRTPSGIVATGGNPNVGLDNVATGTFPPPFSAESYGNNTDYEVQVSIPADDCYTFHITDYYGDGLLAAGFYEVLDQEGNNIIAEDDLTGEEINNFTGKFVVGVNELTNVNAFNVSPNPVSDIAFVNFNLNEGLTTTVEMFNLLGERVYNDYLGKLPAGAHNLTIDVKSMETGIYFLTLTSEGKVTTQKVIVSR